MKQFQLEKPHDDKEVTVQLEKVSLLLNEIRNVRQPRSNYVLDHFVVMQHDTPMRQRMQVLDELDALMFAVADMQDDLAAAQLAYDEAAKDGGKAIEQRRASRTMAKLQIEIEGRMREIKHLVEIADKLPKFDREQFEKEEPEYWMRRLSRQALLSSKGAITGMGEGNVEAILQQLYLPGSRRIMPVIPPEVALAIVAGDQGQPTLPQEEGQKHDAPNELEQNKN